MCHGAASACAPPHDDSCTQVHERTRQAPIGPHLDLIKQFPELSQAHSWQRAPRKPGWDPREVGVGLSKVRPPLQPRHGGRTQRRCMSRAARFGPPHGCTTSISAFPNPLGYEFSNGLLGAKLFGQGKDLFAWKDFPTARGTLLVLSTKDIHNDPDRWRIPCEPWRQKFKRKIKGKREQSRTLRVEEKYLGAFERLAVWQLKTHDCETVASTFVGTKKR
mmetsp:Transcript_21966/g.47786  ORF Transcript_21966/g.47786 Transcript_21966/m.47786 type:complete len:219 (+) Transcript_21966:997-1653(+)